MTVINCPFRLCGERVTLAVMQKDAADDESTEAMIPAHRIEGEARTYGGCPASLMRWPLDAYSREQLVTQARQIARMMRQRRKPAEAPAPPSGPERGREAGEHSLTPRESNPNPIRSGERPKRPTPGPVPNWEGFAGRGVTPLAEGPHAGPGAGRASNPHPPTAADIVEQRLVPKLTAVADLGRETMSDDDLRSQLRALTNLAREGFGQEQEHCSVITACIEAVEAAIELLADKQETTHRLAIAAVGGGGDVPDSAAQMIGASANVGDIVEQLRAGCLDLKTKVEGAADQAGLAADNAEQYLAVI
jgi:hypothetical protein